jgi:hypothetical protein
MRAARISALLLACSLAACGHTHKVVVQAPPPTPPAPERPLVAVPGPGELPEYPVPTLRPGSQSQDQPSDTAATTPPSDQGQQGEANHASSGEEATAAAASTPVQPVDPNRLIGLTENDAVKLLGPPTEKMDSPPSRVWTYRSTACDMKLFFYPEVGGATYRSLTYQIDDRDPADEGYRGCVGSLVKTHAG